MSNTVVFDKEWVQADGNRVCVQEIHEKDGNTWAQAILFSPEGYELVISDVEDDRYGEWVLYHEGNTYTVQVEPELLPEQLASMIVDAWELEDVIAYAVEHITTFYLENPTEFHENLRAEIEDMTPEQIEAEIKYRGQF